LENHNVLPFSKKAVRLLTTSNKLNKGELMSLITITRKSGDRVIVQVSQISHVEIYNHASYIYMANGEKIHCCPDDRIDMDDKLELR
jgi:hypothetical protein